MYGIDLICDELKMALEERISQLTTLLVKCYIRDYEIAGKLFYYLSEAVLSPQTV